MSGAAKCGRCGREFAGRAALASHARRKTPCVSPAPAISPAPAVPPGETEYVVAATELATLAGRNRYRETDRDWWETYAAVAARSPDVRGGFAAALAAALADAGYVLAPDDPELAADAPPERGSAADDVAVRAEAARLEATPGFGAYVAALRREVAADTAGTVEVAAGAAAECADADAETADTAAPAGAAERRVSPDLFEGLRGAAAPGESPAAFFAAARAADPRAAGLAVESAHVAAGALRENNRRCYRAEAAAAPGARLTLIAYVDGVGPGGEVTELKTRRGRLFAHLPAYERCQLGAIALTTGCPAVRLRQVLVGGAGECSYARSDEAALYGDDAPAVLDAATAPPQRLDVFGGDELRASVAAPAAEALRRLAARTLEAGQLAAGLASLPRADLECVAARFAERLARMGGRR